ncbi:hypothetical protein [Psychrobacter sp. VH5]
MSLSHMAAARLSARAPLDEVRTALKANGQRDIFEFGGMRSQTQSSILC